MESDRGAGDRFRGHRGLDALLLSDGETETGSGASGSSGEDKPSAERVADQLVSTPRRATTVQAGLAAGGRRQCRNRLELADSGCFTTCREPGAGGRHVKSDST